MKIRKVLVALLLILMVIWQTFISVQYYNLKKQYESAVTSHQDIPKTSDTTIQKEEIEKEKALEVSVISTKVQNDFTACRLKISNLDNTIIASELLIEVYIGLDTKQLFICPPELINSENPSKNGDLIYEIKFPNNDCNEIDGKVTDLRTSRVAMFISYKEETEG